MILKNLHTENKPVQTQLLFEPKDAKVISLQIAKGETLKAVSYTHLDVYKRQADGYGNFEATEITISSEANGKIEFLKVEEGDELKSQLQVGLVDTLQLHFAKQQLIASKSTVSSKSANIISQKSVLNEQLKTAKLEKNRISNMYAENAATKRQVDEIEGKVKVIEEQIKSVGTQNAPTVSYTHLDVYKRQD